MISDVHSRRLARAWWKENVPRPWMCHFCDKVVTTLGAYIGVVHHLDEDPQNNAPENLAVAHHACHVSFHQAGCVYTNETRAQMSASARARVDRLGYVVRRIA